MPVQTTYPGVYIEEIPSGVRTIVGVSTSVTAFVGYLKRGPLDEAVQVLNFAAFERTFGGLDVDSEVSYAVQQFFLNGGTEAWIVRTAADDATTTTVTDPATAEVTMEDAAGNEVLVAKAANPGQWGNNLRLDVDYDTTEPGSLFNLTVTEFIKQGDEEVAGPSETFRNLSMDPASAAYAVEVVNDGSALLRLELPDSVTHSDATQPPAQTGTTSGSDVSGLLGSAYNGTITVTVADGTTTLASDSFTLDTADDITSSKLRSAIQTGIRSVSGLDKSTVELIGDRLRIRPGVDNPDAISTFADVSPGNLATTLGLTGTGVVENVSAYSLGDGEDAGSQTGAGLGTDGVAPGTTELLGSEADKTGMYALEDVDLFNILCIPRMAALAATSANSLISQATAYCADHRAFLIVDIPDEVNAVEEMKDWIDDNATLRDKNSAVYFPRPMIADPLNGYRLKARPASGTLAGLYAKTDTDRGVWKAAAGTEASLRGVQSLEYKLTDAENGVLNPLGVNCLRTFRDAGNVSWGARTTDGSDQRASEWKYIPVRRTALFIEESLFRGTQWVVFEPNDESLWAQIRMNVGSFMQRLFQQGAFQGTSPREAFFVKCDAETTTQNDIDLGIVNILVGFAPLKPAEFVIIKIQQIAGQDQG